jgi:hypothetical protein
MFLSYFTLLVALTLSGVAAYYSIVGLAAIFAAAVIPIVIMGGTLEVAKLTVTLWLHRYWQFCRWPMKLYLVPAVVVLMLITSMGIFGFLSKAHLDQTVPTGDVAAQVQLIDEKIAVQRELIKSERENIAAARGTLSQMDAQVSARLDRGDSEVSAERSVQIRNQQRRERAELNREITQAQQRIETANQAIATLNIERAPIATQLRKVEAEVGPIKYIAALIYGDQTDANLLEKAVRWVIIVLVAVFDPLAVMLLLAASESIKWERQQRASALATAGTAPALPDESQPPQEPTPEPPPLEPEPEITPEPPPLEPEPEPEPEITPEPPPEVQPSQEIADDQAAPKYDADDGLLTDDQIQQIQESVSEPLTAVEAPSVDPEDDDPETGDATEYEKNLLRKAKTLWKIDNPGATLKEQRRLFDAGKIAKLPWEDYIPAVLAAQTTWGRSQPDHGNKGDFWIDVAHVPTRLYKHNGDAWIAVDKNLTDQYVYNSEYIQYLIEQIDQGQYDPDLLTESEKREIETQLKPAV